MKSLMIIFGFLIVFILGFILGLKYSNKEILLMQDLALKNYRLFQISVNWIKNCDKIDEFIVENLNKKISIYGMSYLGNCLEIVLRKKDVEIMYGIDKNADKLYNSYMPIYNLDSDLPYVDIIIITTINSFEQIKEELKTKVDKKTIIVSLEDIFMDSLIIK